jgi:hypothetical protein
MSPIGPVPITTAVSPGKTSATVDDRRKRLRKRGHVSRDAVGDPVAVGGPDDRLSCEAPVSEHTVRIEVVAMVREPPLAPTADATRDDRVDDDSISATERAALGTDVAHPGDELVSEDRALGRRVTRGVAQDVKVGAADAARLDVEQDVVRPADGRQRPLPDLQATRLDEDRGVHRAHGCSLFSGIRSPFTISPHV